MRETLQHALMECRLIPFTCVYCKDRLPIHGHYGTWNDAQLDVPIVPEDPQGNPPLLFLYRTEFWAHLLRCPGQVVQSNISWIIILLPIRNASISLPV